MTVMTTSQSVIGVRARWLLVGATVFALLGMHSLVAPMGFGPAGAPSLTSPATTPMSSADALTHGSAAQMSVLMAAANHAPSGGHDHALAHLCLAMLGGALLALALGVLGGPARGVAAVNARPVGIGVSRLRAPPWITPSLSELSILRV